MRRKNNALIALINFSCDIVYGMLQRLPVLQQIGEPQHAFAIHLSNEIVRIEKNILRMPDDVRGYKQLKAALVRIKDNFAAHGYEIVEMLNQPYQEGMQVNVDFCEDLNLVSGTQLITSIIKPQINYKGQIIQKATILVSQNI